jgi:hypothetical protein
MQLFTEDIVQRIDGSAFGVVAVRASLVIYGSI